MCDGWGGAKVDEEKMGNIPYDCLTMKSVDTESAQMFRKTHPFSSVPCLARLLVYGSMIRCLLPPHVVKSPSQDRNLQKSNISITPFFMPSILITSRPVWLLGTLLPWCWPPHLLIMNPRKCRLLPLDYNPSRRVSNAFIITGDLQFNHARFESNKTNPFSCSLLDMMRLVG